MQFLCTSSFTYIYSNNPKYPLTDDSIVSPLCEKNKANKRMEKERCGFTEDREAARRRIMSEHKEARKRKQTCSEQRPPEPTIVSRLIHLMHCRAIINFFIRLAAALEHTERKNSLVQKYITKDYKLF